MHSKIYATLECLEFPAAPSSMYDIALRGNQSMIPPTCGRRGLQPSRRTTRSNDPIFGGIRKMPSPLFNHHVQPDRTAPLIKPRHPCERPQRPKRRVAHRTEKGRNTSAAHLKTRHTSCSIAGLSFCPAKQDMTHDLYRAIIGACRNPYKKITLRFIQHIQVVITKMRAQ